MRRFYNTANDRGSSEFYNDIGALRHVHTQEVGIFEAFADIFREHYRSFKIVAMLHILQQLSGINVILFFGHSLLRDAGFGNDNSFWVWIGSLFLGAVYFLGASFATCKMDSLGRRKLMRIFTPIMIVGMLMVSASMFLKHKLDFQKCKDLIVIIVIVSGLTGLFGAIIFLFAYSLGFMVQPWLIVSEIFPVS